MLQILHVIFKAKEIRWTDWFYWHSCVFFFFLGGGGGEGVGREDVVD